MSDDQDNVIFIKTPLQEFCVFTRDPHPRTFRRARKPDGTIILQGGYIETRNWESRLVWEELPIVDVDEAGNEIQIEENESD